MGAATEPRGASLIGESIAVAMAEAMHAAIPHSELTVIPAARHFTPIEVPETVAAELTALVRGSKS
jgi:pimeloyl-ACP methyl ester carboxylesterase